MGDPLDLKKRFLQCWGVILHEKKILQNQKFLKYVQECPVKCLWLKSKIAQLSPTPTLNQISPSVEKHAQE